MDQEPSMLDLVKSSVGRPLVRESIALRKAHAHRLVIVDAVNVSSDLTFITLAKRVNEPGIAVVFSLLCGRWRN